MADVEYEAIVGPLREAINGHKPAATVPPPPPMPLDGFPPWLRDWIEATARARQVAPELPASAALAVLSACTARRLRVNSGNGWGQELAGYFVTVLPSGERKSPVTNDAAAPLYQAELEDIEQWRQDCALIDARGEGEKPPHPGLLADDSTIEKLAVDMQDWNEKAVIMAAEGDPLDNMSGRYGGGVYLAPWLKFHTGEFTKVRRITRDPVFLKRPALTLFVTCQASPLSRFASLQAVVERGLLARMLICQPVSRVGYRDSLAPPRLAAVQNVYVKNVLHLYRALRHVDDELELSPEAAAELIAYEQALEPLMRPGERWGTAAKRELAAKAAGLALRVAAWLHAAKYLADWRRPIETSTLWSAMVIVDWYMQDAERIYPLLLAGSPLEEVYCDLAAVRPEGAAEVLEWLERQGCKVSRRDVYRRFWRHSWCRKVSQLHQLLQWMEDRGEIYYEQETAKFGEGGGHSGRTWWASAWSSEDA